MTTAIQSAPPTVEYPDSDGLPMAENTLQFKWIVLVKEGIEAVFADDPNVFVAGDLFWYPVEGDPHTRTAPDVLVAFGRPKGNRGSYKTWVENGIPPQVVFEILSPSNRPSEMERKRLFYEKHGVEEYYIYDPDSGLLEGWLRNNQVLEPNARMEGFISPRLQIRFEPGEGPDNLTILDRSGKPFLTPLAQRLADEARTRKATALVKKERRIAKKERQLAEKERQLAQEQRAHAEREHERAEEERLRADAQQLRADRLAAKLRELGIETD